LKEAEIRKESVGLSHTVNYRPLLSSERALQNNKHADV
jgi:hypothetical protein